MPPNNDDTVCTRQETQTTCRGTGGAVRLVACTMTMDLMGIKREESIDGVEEGSVAMYLDTAGSANVNPFIG
jgi:peroxiredoxin family protein